MSHRPPIWLVSLCLAACTARPLESEIDVPNVVAPEDLRDYARIVWLRQDGQGYWRIQTSARVLRDDRTGSRITLMSAVHVGKDSYYHSLALHLRDADLIISEGDWGVTDDLELGEGLDWIRRRYRAVTELLSLTAQVHWEDSVRDKRWIAADLSLQELNDQIEASETPVVGEKFKTRVRRMESAIEGELNPEETKRTRSLAGRWVLWGVQGRIDPNGSLMRTRDPVLFREVARQLESGRHKRIVVLYGAAHMPILEARLHHAFTLWFEGSVWHDVLEVKAQVLDPRPEDGSREMASEDKQ